MSFDLEKSLPKPGARFTLPTLHGSADAYALAHAALTLKARGQMLTIVVANATDAQRLLSEIPWFAGAPRNEPDGKDDEPPNQGNFGCHLLADGFGAALAAASVWRYQRDHPNLSCRYPALFVSGQGNSLAAGPRIPHG